MQALVLVGFGGALGAMARYGAGVLVGRLFATGFPLATLLINIGGSLAMGLLVGLLASVMPPWAAEARLFFGVGVLGGFTTFSAYALDAVELGDWRAGGYLVLSVLCGLAATAAAAALTRRVAS